MNVETVRRNTLTSEQSERFSTASKPPAIPARGRLSGHNQVLVGLHNRGAVLRAVLEHGTLSRRELARLTGLTPPAVTYIVRDLTAQSLLVEAGNSVKT